MLLLLLPPICRAESLGAMAERLPPVDNGPITALVEKYDAELRRCTSGARCALPTYYFAELTNLRTLSPWEQLRQVDRWVNKRPYHSVDGPGETVDEFLKHGGSCKEYTLTKLVMLRDLGFGLENLWPAGVQEPEGGYHELLLVRIDGALMVLSNYVPDHGAEPATLASSPFHDYTAQWISRLSAGKTEHIADEDHTPRCG